MSADSLANRAPIEEVERWVGLYGGFRADGEDVWPSSDPVAGGVRALREAMGRAGTRDREGAFALLAADALFTYAVERAAEHPDPESELRGLLSRIGALAVSSGA